MDFGSIQATREGPFPFSPFLLFSFFLLAEPALPSVSVRLVVDPSGRLLLPPASAQFIHRSTVSSPVGAFPSLKFPHGEEYSGNGSADTILPLTLSSSIFLSRFSLRESLLHCGTCADKSTSANWVNYLWWAFLSPRWTLPHGHCFKSCSLAVLSFFGVIIPVQRPWPSCVPSCTLCFLLTDS